MKRGCPDHPKTFALAEFLGVRRVQAVGTLELLFHFTAQYAPEGDIGRYSDKRIAAAVDWAGKAEKLIDGLVTTGWVDRHSVARLVLHDWNDHADRHVLQRLSRNGKKVIQQNQVVTGNLCEQSETENKADRNEEVGLPVPVPVPVPVPEPVPEKPKWNHGTFFEERWHAHKYYSPKESFDHIVRQLMSKNGDLDWERFRDVHPRWCEYWERKGWNAFGSLTLWAWIEAKMPEPPAAGKDRNSAIDQAFLEGSGA